MSSYVRISLADLLPGEPVNRVFTTFLTRSYKARLPYWLSYPLKRLRRCLRPSSPLSDDPVLETVKRKLNLPELSRMLDEYSVLQGIERVELAAARYLPGTPITLDETRGFLDFWKCAGYPQSLRAGSGGSGSHACRSSVSIALRLLDSCCVLARTTGRERNLEDLISMCRNDGVLGPMLGKLSPREWRLPELRWLARKWLTLDPFTKAAVRAELPTVIREINHPVS